MCYLNNFNPNGKTSHLDAINEINGCQYNCLSKSSISLNLLMDAVKDHPRYTERVKKLNELDQLYPRQVLSDQLLSEAKSGFL